MILESFLNKNLFKINRFFLLLIISLLFACTDEIQVDIEKGEKQLIVDAWITTEYDTQIIKLRETIPYFQSGFAPRVTEATIKVTDLINQKTVSFIDIKNNGDYIWAPQTPSDTFEVRIRTNPEERESGGFYNAQYRLDVTLRDGSSYFSFTSIERNAKIDSIHFERRKELFDEEELIYTELFARDVQGLGDCYWIKSYINGGFLHNPEEINIAYDAAFSAGSKTDGVYFIQPIREAITPDIDIRPDHKIYIEIWSITELTFLYIDFFREQLTNGGFFSVPPANSFSNIIATDPDNFKPAVGFFAGSNIISIHEIVPKLEKIPLEE